MKSQVAILRTRPETVVEDYGRLMRLLKYDQVLARDQHLILKLNLSWTKYFPACSSQPWQVDGVATTLLAGQIMVSSGYWQPATALYLLTAVSVPFLLRHAVVAQ